MLNVMWAFAITALRIVFVMTHNKSSSTLFLLLSKTHIKNNFISILTCTSAGMYLIASATTEATDSGAASKSMLSITNTLGAVLRHMSMALDSKVEDCKENVTKQL